MSEESFPCPEGEPKSSLVITKKDEPSPELLCLHEINAALARHGCKLVPRFEVFGESIKHDVAVARA